MAFIKYSSEVKNAVIAAMNRYYILQGWGFDAAYRQVRMELQRDGKQMPSTHTVWKWIKPYMFRNLAESCKKTDLTDLTDKSDGSDKRKFTPEVCREMYDALHKIANMNPGESYDEECSIYEDCSTCYDMIDIAKEALLKVRGE